MKKKFTWIDRINGIKPFSDESLPSAKKMSSPSAFIGDPDFKDFKPKIGSSNNTEQRSNREIKDLHKKSHSPIR